MGTKSKNVFVNQEMVDEFNEKYSNATTEAEKNNLKYTIIDKGCLVNSLYNYPLNMTFFSTSDRLEIGEIPFISNNSKPTRLEALEYYRRVCSHWKLNINLYEKVLSIKKEKHFKYPGYCLIFFG